MTVQDEAAGFTIDVETAGWLCGLGETRSWQSAKAGELPVLRFGKKSRVPLAPLSEMLGVPVSELVARLEAKR
jgi:hypothetical protein